MLHETKISRGYHGLSAVSEINLNKATEQGSMFLRVTTSKRSSGGVSTHATVIYKKPDNSFSTMVFQDYSKTVASAKIARVTEKSLREFHVKSLELLPPVMVEVATQYSL